MEVVYCDNCGFKITPDAFSSGAAVHADDGRIYCDKCKPLFKFTTTALQNVLPPAKTPGDDATGDFTTVKAAPAERSATKFYFCETCGKRITDKQIEDGLGRDKKLKGVYCKACAAGVMTIEFAAINEPFNDAVAPSRTHPAKPSTPGAGTKGSALGIAPARSTTSKQSDKHGNQQFTSDRGRSFSTVILLGILVVTGITILLLISPKSRPPSVQSHPTSKKVDSVPAEVNTPPISPSTSISVSPPPADKSKITPVVQKSDPDALAKAAFDKLQKFDELAEGDTSGRIVAVEAFLKDYSESNQAVPAKALLETLKSSAPQDKTSTSPVATVKPPLVDDMPNALTQPSAAPGPQNVDLDKHCRELLSALRDRNFTSTPQIIGRMGLSQECVLKLQESVDRLQKGQGLFLEALRSKIGQQVRLETTSKGIVIGKLNEVNKDTLKVEQSISNSDVQASMVLTVLICDLTPAAREQFASRKPPADVVDWLANCLEQWRDGQYDAAKISAEKAAGHPAQPSLLIVLEAEERVARDAEAKATWEQIESKFKANPSGALAKALGQQIQNFDTKYKSTTFAQNAEQTQRRNQLIEALKHAELAADPRILKALKGRLDAFDPGTCKATLVYDFKSEEQLSDWGAAVYRPQGGWRELVVDKSGMRVHLSGIFEKRFQIIPVFASDSKLTLEYKIIRGRHLVVCFYGPGSKGQSPKLTLLGGENGIVLSNEEFQGADILKAPTLAKSDVPLPEEGKIEIGCQNDRYYAIVNGKTVLEYKASRPNDHTGLTWGGSFDTIIQVKQLTLTGKLDLSLLKQ